MTDPDIIIRGPIDPNPLGNEDIPDLPSLSYYYVELYDGSATPWPMGMAFVVEWPAYKECKKGCRLNYLFVIARRKGYGTRLVEACRERWPSIETSCTTDEGALLMASIDQEIPA